MYVHVGVSVSISDNERGDISDPGLSSESADKSSSELSDLDSITRRRRWKRRGTTAAKRSRRHGGESRNVCVNIAPPSKYCFIQVPLCMLM